MSEPERRLSKAEHAAVWRARLEKAKAEYDFAVATFRRSAEECRFRESHTADSDFSLRHAIRAENHARERYVSILKSFTDLIISGKVPPED
jgi:putative ribosome biogenesis GTPase RsgA